MIPFNAFISNGPRAGVARGQVRSGLRGGLRGACGDMPGVGEMLLDGDPMARDIAGDTAGPMKLVGTVWVQRAINAWYAAIHLASRVVVDGHAGPQTLSALADIRRRLIASMGGSGLAAFPRIVDPAHVAIAPGQYITLSLGARVADPVGSTVGLCSWSAAAHMVPDAPSTTPVDPSASTMVPASSAWSTMSSGFSVETVVIPAIAFLSAAALGVVLVKVGAPRRGRR